MKPKSLTRKELYNLVWQKPLTHIAKELGITYQEVRVACKEHNIPLPIVGYWSKLKFNKKVSKTPLPESDSKVLEINFRTVLESKKASLISDISKLKLSNGESNNLSLKVPQKLSKPDPLILEAKEYFKELKVRRPNTDLRFIHSKTGVLSISVSYPLLSRALRFMDTFIKLIKNRGHQILVEKNRGYTVVIIGEEEYNIRLIEKHKRVKKNTNYSWDTFDLVPTGSLCLKTDKVYPQKEWADTKTKPIEAKLADIIVWFEIRAEEDKIERIESEIQNKKRKEERKKQEELQQLKDQELSKFQKMFDTATRWQKTQYIRNYIKEYEAYALKTSSLDNEKMKWIEWANEKADWYDPFIEKEVELLEDIDRETLKKKNRSYW